MTTPAEFEPHDSRCPRCNHSCPVLEYDPLLGNIYECYRCQRFDRVGILSFKQSPYRWVNKQGRKLELVDIPKPGPQSE